MKLTSLILFAVFCLPAAARRERWCAARVGKSGNDHKLCVWYGEVRRIMQFVVLGIGAAILFGITLCLAVKLLDFVLDFFF